MTDTTFRFDDVPMAFDRTAGWSYFRAAGDVFEADGAWWLTGVEVVQFAQQHPEIFSSARAFDSIGSPLPLIPLAVDPPDHVRYRRILDPMLAPKVINAMEDELRRQAGDLIDAFAANGECDVMTDLARLYPTQVFMTLFGLPLADRDQFLHWVEIIVKNAPVAEMEPTPEVLENALALFAYLQGFVDAKREAPADDLLSRVLALEGRDAWTNEEVLGMCFLFTLAGLDTVTAEIGFVLYHLARDPDLRARIVADPTLVAPYLEEVLRLELPAPITPRVALSDVEIGGRLIPAGAKVNIVAAAANRDPSRYPHPDEIAIDDTDRPHYGFGGGIHRCLGSHLARRELRLVLEEFHKRIPEYALADGIRPKVQWPSGTLALESLPLSFP